MAVESLLRAGRTVYVIDAKPWMGNSRRKRWLRRRLINNKSPQSLPEPIRPTPMVGETKE